MPGAGHIQRATVAVIIGIGQVKKDHAALVVTVPYSLRGSGLLVIQHR